MQKWILIMMYPLRLFRKLKKVSRTAAVANQYVLCTISEMDAGLLEFLMRKMNMSKKDNLIPGGRIHNFRHFMDFPDVIQ